MCNAASKISIIALVAVASAACTTEAERRAEAADNLHTQAEAMVASGAYDEAIVLLDSLDSAYREQTATRRVSLATRAAAIEGRALQQIGPAEQRLAKAQMRADSLAALFVSVDGPRGLEGYSVARELAGQNVTASTGVQPRIGADGYLTLAAVVKGKSIGLNSASVTTAGGTVAVEPAQAGRRVSSEGSELLMFRQEEVTPLLEALEQAGDGVAKMHLDGTGGSVEIKLTAELRAALVRSWQYAMARQALRSALIERERLERVLQTARDHRANAPAPEQQRQ